jgi:hypothetical protein
MKAITQTARPPHVPWYSAGIRRCFDFGKALARGSVLQPSQRLESHQIITGTTIASMIRSAAAVAARPALVR